MQVAVPPATGCAQIRMAGGDRLPSRIAPLIEAPARTGCAGSVPGPGVGASAGSGGWVAAAAGSGPRDAARGASAAGAQAAMPTMAAAEKLMQGK